MLEGVDNKVNMIKAYGIMDGACEDEEDRVKHVRDECQDTRDLPFPIRNVRCTELQSI